MDESTPTTRPPEAPNAAGTPPPAGPPTFTPPDGPPTFSDPPPGPEAAVGWVRPETRRGPKVLVVVMLVVALLVLGAIAALIFIGANASPFDKAIAKATVRLVADPAFTARYGNVKGDDAFKLGGQLVTDGIKRTDASTQLALAQSIDKIVNVADPAACAGIVKGTVTPADTIDAIEKLDEASLNAYMDASVTAALASLHGDPIRAVPSDSDSLHAQQAWLDSVGRDKFSADVDLLQGTGTQSNADVCAAGRELWDSAVGLPEPDRGNVVQLLFNP